MMILIIKNTPVLTFLRRSINLREQLNSPSVKRTYTITDNSFTLPKPSLNGYTFKGWIGGIDKKDPVRDTNGKTYSTSTGNITVPKGTYGDYFFRAMFEKNHSSVDGNRTDDVYVAHSESKEKQY